LSQSQVSNALNIGGAIYFGQAALTRLDQRIADAMPPKVMLPARELPGDPVWHDDGTDQTPPAATARDQIRAYARPTPATPPGIESDRFVATYFRIVMGLRAEDASLGWVRSFDHNVLGGAAARGGFALCDASGKVTLLDEAGGTAGNAALGQSVMACVVQAGTLQIPDGKPLPPLPEQIAQAIQVKDAQMAAGQRFLLFELGRVEAPIATKALIDIASNPRTPAELLNDARRLLAQRRNGAEHMLEALKRHYDFLGDILRPPPVGPLADALAAMNEQRAAPLLAEHLNDPANSVDDVERTARALAKLATAAQADDLKTFFALYRATADQTELVNAVVFSAEALLRIGGEEGRRIVERAVEDPLTHPQVKSGLATLMPATNRAGSR
jgi:outer membrane protein assembly factor BamB